MNPLPAPLPQVILLIFFAIFIGGHPLFSAPPNPGQFLPEFNVKCLDGSDFGLSHHRGKIVILHFWATWFRHSRQELLLIKGVTRGITATSTIALLGVSLDKDIESLRGFLAREGVTWPQFCDGRGYQNFLCQIFEIRGIPANIIIDPQGKCSGVNLDLAQIIQIIRNHHTLPATRDTRDMISSVSKVPMAEADLGEVLAGQNELPTLHLEVVPVAIAEVKRRGLQLHLIENLVARREFEGALKKSLNMINSIPGKGAAPFHFQAGICLLAMGNLGRAESYFRQAMRLDSDFTLRCEEQLNLLPSHRKPETR